MHEAVYNMFDYVHVLCESTHDRTVWCHIEEEVHWCVQYTFKNICVHLFKCFVDQFFLNEFFRDLTHRLEEYD